jgi:hypothetical protein
LTPEAEVGLIGEIIILKNIIEACGSASTAMNSWKGPHLGIHDFLLGTGGIEVKTTASYGAFPARISSKEQLDDSLVQPLFLAGVRLKQDAQGMTLPEFVDEAKRMMLEDTSLVERFENLLIEVGFAETYKKTYTRRFDVVEIFSFRINDSFPRLTTKNLRAEIKSATYEIDLTSISGPRLGIETVIKELLA